MPDTAAGLGVNPHDPKDNIRGGAKYLRELLDTFDGDTTKAVAAYNAGPEAVRKYGGTPPFQETQDYVRKVLGGSYALDGVFNRSTDPFGAKAPIVPTIEPTPHSIWTETKDKFLNAVFDSALIGTARTAWVGASANNAYSDQSFRLSQDDVDYVTKALPGDFVAQKFVLMNARDRESLARLTQMKQEDEARRQRVDSYSMGLSSIGTIAGTIADPLAFLPLGQEAVILKAIGRLGPVASKLALSKVAKYGELAATNAALNVAERYGAERNAGYEQDYTSAALVGAAAGAGLGMLGDVARSMMSKKGLQKVVAKLENAEDHAILQASDGPLPSAVPKETRGDIKALHDANFKTDSENLSKLIDKDMVYVVSKDDLKSLEKRWGVSIPETAKAFHKEDEGYTVLVKDNLKPTDNIDNILAHEVGVHAGLRETLGDEAYGSILDAVKKRVENPQGPWKDAVKAVPDGGLEEVLGHFIERGKPENEVFQKLKASVSRGLRRWGLTENISDAELKDFVKRSFEAQVEKAQGYRTLPDGTAVVNGLKYSNANLFNPNILAHQFAADTKAETQGDFPKYLRGITQRLEAGKFAGTIGGMLSNSVSHVGRQLATLFHDARMREYKGPLVMPPEKMKERLQTRLNKFWGDFMDVRSDAIFGDTIGDRLVNGPKVLMLHSKMIEFNRQVRECFNATYTNNHAGLLSREWSPEVLKAAGIIKDLRDDMVEIGKKSSEMFGTKGENLIFKDWKPFDTEMWRILDDDKWLNFHNKFPTVEAARGFLEEYAKRSAKKDIFEQILLDKKVKEWEEAQAKWEKEHAAWKKEMDERIVPTEKVQDKLERNYQKKLEEYNRKLEEWKLDAETAPKGYKKPPKPKKPEKPPEVSLPREKAPPKEPGERPTEVSPEELEQFISEEASDWAYGVIDRDHSNIELLKNGKHNDGAVLFMLRERFPMDTSVKMQTPWGEEFSFDTHLRDDDLDRIIPKVISRFSGEAALKNAFATPDMLKEARAKFESQLLHAEGQRAITKEQMARELNAFDDGINLIRGTFSQKDPKGAWDAASRLFTNLSYAQNGANMGFNQMGEVGGAIAYSGGRALFHILPELSNYVRALRSGKDVSEAVQRAELHSFGDSLEGRIWQRSFQSRVFKEATTAGDAMRHLDTVNTGINFMSRIVSQINMLPKLTERMVRGARADAIADSLEWAAGKEFSKIRNPFSSVKLKAAGVSEELAGQIKQDLQKYFPRDAEGTMLSPRLEEWASENPETYWKWVTLIDNQGMRSITQSTIGNKNVLKDSSVFSRMFFQFKDFTLKAINGQTLRALTSREIDDGLAALFSMGTNMAVYAGLTYGRAKAYFPDDEGKRKEYLDSRLSPGQLATAAILRGVITGSFLSFANDAYEAATGSQSFRTTVDRTAQFKGKQNNPMKQDLIKEPKDIVGDSLAQLPAFRASIGNAYTLGKVGKNYYDTNQVTQRDLKDLYRTLPLQNFLPAVYISSILTDESGLPKDKIKRK